MSATAMGVAARVSPSRALAATSYALLGSTKPSLASLVLLRAVVMAASSLSGTRTAAPVLVTYARGSAVDVRMIPRPGGES